MYAFVAPILGLILFQDPAAAQDKDPRAVYQEVMQSLPRPQRGASREESAEAQKQRTQLVEKALQEHAAVWSSGDGLHYGARLLQMVGKRDEATKALLAHVEADGASELAQQSRLTLVQSLMYDDPSKAKQLLADLDESKITDERAKAQLPRLGQSLEANVKRVELNGKPAPAIAASHVLEAGAAEGKAEAFDLAKYRGKIVVIDFWATWCPPCRAVIPDLVKMQAAHGKDGVQVLGVTRFYGRGMDFSAADAEKPHGGKSVNQLSQEAELDVNRAFMKAFELNYPVVFTKNDEGKDDYHVVGIPTVFVLDKQGNVVGSVVGGDHAKIEGLLAKALGGKASTVDAAGSKAQNH